MSEVVSFEGVMKLRRMKREELPSNWKEMIEHYIEIKKKMIPIKMNKGLDTTEDQFRLLKALDVLREMERDERWNC